MKATHCWQSYHGQWHVGFPLMLEGCELSASWSPSRVMVNYHTGQIEAVPVAWLRPYPIEEIKQP
jgi:hypothetical protein